MKDPVMIMTTTNSEKEARSLAFRIVEEHLAACVQIIPKIEAIYEWEGEVRSDQEYLLLLKTRESCVKPLKKLMEKEHSYEVPEFLVVPIVDGMQDYLDWMEAGTR